MTFNEPPVHMGSMNIDQILSTVGTTREELNNVVDAHRVTSAGDGARPTVQPDVEKMATVIEQLASRLAAVHSIISPLVPEEGPQSILAKTVVHEINPGHRQGAAIIASHLIGKNPEELLLSESIIYGHPHLRHVTHGELDHESKTFVFTGYIVDIVSGCFFSVKNDETPAQAAARYNQNDSDLAA